ncbi:MAG: c-type cytochrome [Nitrospinaceae bacterium]
MGSFQILAGLILIPGWLTAGVVSPSGADLQLGEKIFMKRCKVCHGVRGDGKSFAASVLNPPPRNFISEKSKKELTRERMIRSVTQGRPGTAMMPWEKVLSPREIRAVVHYIRTVLIPPHE